jgi:hypothetical protein
MRLTIHGRVLPIPETLARYAQNRMSLALRRDFDRIRNVTLRMVQLRDDAPPHWVSIIDLGPGGAVVTRVRAIDRLAAIDELARRSAESVAHRLAMPPRLPARVVTRMLA